jgi:DNA-binding NtrC family response regulator
VLARLLRAREREILVEYLQKHRGHVGETATALGLSRRALDYKLDEHGLRDDAAELRADAGIGGPRGSQ